MHKSYRNAYSRDYQLQIAAGKLIGLITYADGSQRFLEYDTAGVANKMVDPDFTVHTRVDADTWTTDKGETWKGKIAVVQMDIDEGLPGTVLITKFGGEFPIQEGLYFPHGISVDSGYLHDRTEVSRSVRFLSGQHNTYSRHDRNSLWMTNGEMAGMMADSPWNYALPWECPVFMEATAVA